MLSEKNRWIVREVLLSSLTEEMDEIVRKERRDGVDDRTSKVQWNIKREAIESLMNQWNMTIPMRLMPYQIAPESPELIIKRRLIGRGYFKHG